MRSVLSCLLLLLLPARLLADGRVFPPIAFPTEVSIPDQRALIHFTNGTERLVIEMRFTAAGTNFAWVVPLPNPPVVEPATTGVFPTLQYLFQPRVTHHVTRYYITLLAAIGLISLFRILGHSTLDALAILLLLFVMAALLLPTLSPAGRSMGPGAETEVSILDRRRVGVFETTTITSRDPRALQGWLLENGFAAPPRAEPVIADYVKDHWVFVAAKVRRDIAGRDTSTPHPLSFTFKTDRPVYPMRLTGVDNGPLQVELYVFGPGRASAAHFEVARCTQPVYPNLATGAGWFHRSPETPRIVHPVLRRWLDGASVATKLTATLSPADMRQDVWIDWAPFREKLDHRFSSAGALTLALNWAVGILVVVWLWLLAYVFLHERYKPRLPKMVGTAILLSAMLAGAIYSSLPKTEVRLVHAVLAGSKHNLLHLYFEFDHEKPVSLSEARTALQRYLAQSTNSATLQPPTPLRNELLGGLVREEDSPGNFVLRLNEGQVEFVGFDSRGAPEVLGKWPAR